MQRSRGRYPKGATVPPPDHIEQIELWERALASPNGIAVPSANPRALSTRLYRARIACGHERYHGLALRVVDGELWIAPRRR